jgi:RNA polymerase sigma factor (TIGR02999 family)
VPSPSGDGSEGVTRLLEAAAAGHDVLDEIFRRVYDELHELAGNVRGRRGDATLDTTGLVHEAYIKLVPSRDTTWESRSHFFGVAARAMRQILVDKARRRVALKRGGQDRWAVTFDEALHATPVEADELLALDRALERLAGFDDRRARVVEYRFFAGLSIADTASVMAVSTATVERDWRTARAWLTAELEGGAA